MEKEIVNLVKEAQRFPYRINPRRNMPRHTPIKLTKTKHKERILKAAREKQQVTYKRSPICLTADFSAETLQARREWHDIFKVLKRKNLQPRLLYSARISFKTDKEIKLRTSENWRLWGFPCMLLVACPLLLLIFFLCVQSLLV